jgi:N-acetylmuramoyl-L-alanine amidase
VLGRLDVRVIYPRPGATIQARDSTFIFGSSGSGDATLRINGQPVEVLPNGSFLGWVPVPEAEGAFELVARRGGDSSKVRVPVVIPPRPVPLARGGPLADLGSLLPRGVQARLSDELVRVSIRASPEARVTLVPAIGDLIDLVRSSGDSTFFAADVPAPALNGPGRIVIRRTSNSQSPISNLQSPVPNPQPPDSLSLPAPRIVLADSSGRVFATLGAASVALPDTDRVVIGRPVAGGTYKWFFLPQTVVEVTGRSNDEMRVAIASGLDVWVNADEVGSAVAGGAAPVRVVANARVLADPAGEWSELVLPIGQRPAWSVDAIPGGLTLTLYGTTANTDIINYAAGDSLVSRVTWEQVLRDRARYTIEFRQPLFGYLVLWRNGALVLRMRRAPRVDPVRPLAGLRIVVDAGHPPGGSTGPTGLYEPVATLAISERVRALLEQRGASVIMTRTSPSALGLAERPLAARRANAHAFVSIHLNALPDGVNPFRAHGTGTYYFTPQSVDLARAVQQGMVRHMGLRDLGINYDNLAVIRPTWMPSILAEGAFIMIPEQEAALRAPEFQQAYAAGVVEGIEAYFRGLRR